MNSDMMRQVSVTARCAAAFRCERLEPLGIRGPQYAMILRIAREPGITQEALSRALCIHKSNIARQVEKLETAGYVTRQSDDGDRRLSRLYPTDAAKAVVPEILDALRSWSAYLTAEMTPEEMEQITALLEKIRLRAVAYFETGKID